MYIDYTPEERKLQTELRAYFAGLITEDVRSEWAGGGEGGGPNYTRVLKHMAKDGWLGIGWPKEFGGLDRPAIEQHIFFDEVQRAGFPIPFLTLCTVGPTLIKFGTDEQKAKMLPPILRGETHFAIGYSEPGAGTDLASLKTTAVRDGDHYVVNGQKVYTSLAEYADYIWLAVRTNPDAPKHKGISILIVDTKSPGFSYTPIHTLGGNRTNATYYDNVRVPVSMRVAGENEGWKLITTQLNHERVALSAPGPAARFVEEVTAWARETRLPDGRRVIDHPWVQANLARAKATIDVLELMTWRQASNITRGMLDPAEASAVKVFGSEGFLKVYQILLEVLGQAAYVKDGSPGAIMGGRLEMYARMCIVLTFGGGTNEVQRDIIATIGLKVPRSRLGERPWTSPTTRPSARWPSFRARSSPIASRSRHCERSRRTPIESIAPCGRIWPTPACSPRRFPRNTAAAATVCWRCRRCWSRPARRRPWSRCGPRWCWPRCPSPNTARPIRRSTI
jgi:hypothetical protein